MTMNEIQSSNKIHVCVQRKLGLASSISMTLSAIIGAGIFISPKATLKYTGSVGMSLVIWGLSGFISTTGAMCFVELGTSIPLSGSKYSYLLTFFGELPAFLYLWTFILILTPVFNVVLSLTFSNYILEFFLPNCAISPGIVRLVAVLPLCLLTYVNCRKVHWATRLQVVFTSTKILALTTIIIAGAYHLYSGNTQNFEDPFHKTTMNPGFMALGIYHGLYAFGGWDFINHVTEELKNPSVNLPRNIYISLSIATIIYVLANVAYLAVLTPNEILTSKAVAVSVCEKLFGTMSSSLMSLFVAVSTFGTLNCRIFRCSRLFFTAAKEGHLPNLLSMVHVKYLTPVPSVIFVLLLSLIYLSTTEILFLVNYGKFVDGIFTFLTILGFLWLRYKEPNLERPVMVSLFFPVTYLLVTAFLVILPFFADPWEPLMGLVVIATGLPIYVYAVLWKNKPNLCNETLRKLSSFTQKLLLIEPEEKSE